LALLLNVFSVVTAWPKADSAPIGTVYCPLTRKFQPVKAPRTRFKATICASSERTHEFEAALAAFGLARSISSDANHLEDLVFDFFENGVSAVLYAPFRLPIPKHDTRKSEDSALLTGNPSRTDEDPLTVTDANFYCDSEAVDSPETTVTSERSQSFFSTIIDRRRAPRAPPVIL
jgi:hypothetical protein